MTRPMVVRFGALGDMVLMTVAIRTLHERFGEPVDVLGSGEWTQPLLEGQPGVGDIYLMGSRHRPYWLAADQWRLVRDLRRRGPGPTWLFDSRNERTLWLLRRAGWADEHLLTLDGLPDIPEEHFCDHWRRFALLGSPVPGKGERTVKDTPAYPELRMSAAAKEAVFQWLKQRDLVDRPLILVQVGNKRTMRRGQFSRPSNTKYWPEERWASVLKELHALHPEHILLLLGITPEAELNDRILEMARVSQAFNLAREMNVPRLMALAERAAGMISVDTGPAHVAAAMGCPLLTLFDSASKAVMYAPRGLGSASRRSIVSPDAEPPSLLGISVDDVLGSWREMRLRSTPISEDTLTAPALFSGATAR